jgi:hypothetical protein
MNSRKEQRTMKLGKFVALLAVLSLIASASADTLRLRSGQTIQGTFLSADTRELKFLVANGQARTFSLSEVSGITFASLPAPVPAPIAPPPRPTHVTLLAGSTITVRMLTGVSTETSKAGDLFTATLDTNLMSGGWVVAPRGTTVHGKVIKSENARRLTGRSELQVELIDIVINGAAQPISTNGFQQAGKSEGAQTAIKTAGGAGLGAAIGAISGNAGKGAAIGAVSGLGISLIKKGQPIKFPAETLLQFSLSQPTLVPLQR